MKSIVRFMLAILVCGISYPAFGTDMRDTLLREQAIRYGLEPAAEYIPPSPLSAVGEKLFSSEKLSLNGDTSCQTCHLDRFSSTDGLANAIGVGGQGEGTARMESDGTIVPRNTLPLWGRGEDDFRLFFWDGKVDGRGDEIISQFREDRPSDDPLTIAVHLPFVEIREMVVDDDFVTETLKREDVSAAEEVFNILTTRVRSDPELGPPLAQAYGVPVEELQFDHVADAIAAFIRQNFQRRSTKFQNYVFGDDGLSDAERKGALLYYGKGRCILCHNGPHFSDFEFHAVPFPQEGFGKNGFGVDYGRYNVTNDDRDLYKFRTPPLTNVAETGPYSHSGSVGDLREAIVYHFDPPRYADTSGMPTVQRIEYYKRLGAAASDPLAIPILSDAEVANVAAFLRTLSFTPPARSQ